MKPIKIIVIFVLFILMVVSSLQILGYINSDQATDTASKSIYVVMIVGFFIVATFFLVRGGGNVSKENKAQKPPNSGPDFN